MKREASLPYSQKSSNYRYPQLDQHIPCPHIHPP